MRVIGTAGHVDHGKSTLVKSLTGIDPDRLAEEKAREMTIDLGFAWLTLNNGETVGVVDVPGHRDFIENMLAGVGGIDAVLLVIAADEGVMPQTQEHLAILDLLGIQDGLIVLSKSDLIGDPDWFDLIEDEIRQVTRGTTLESADMVRVSSYTGEGIPELLHKLAALLADLPPRRDTNAPRLPIDRIFTISGFGTVVTGTLLDGKLAVGDEVEIQPSGLSARIRGLQTYKQSVETALPGSRAAVNLAGVDKKAIQRGDVLTHPGQLQPTVLADLRFRHLPGATRPLQHDAEVKLFVGAAEATAHVRLLSDDILPPGSEGWMQIRLDEPLALAQGDRFILRFPSPGETIGGGVVVDPHPAHRWKRFQPQVIAQLETRMLGTPAERVTQAAAGPEPVKRPALQRQVGYNEAELNAAIGEAVSGGFMMELPDGSFLAAETWERHVQEMVAALTEFHANDPLRLGLPREELRSRMALKISTLNMLLEMTPQIVIEDHVLRLTAHQIHFDEQQTAVIQTLMQAMEATPYTPPSYAEAAEITGEPVLRALIELGQLVQVQPDVIFTEPVYRELVAATLKLIDETGGVTASQLRDAFNTSRKYAIGLLEHLDSIGVTRRMGDTRVRGPRSS
jgi:selenocysteine-specific elongation factor